jgi:hypothetical protein
VKQARTVRILRALLQYKDTYDMAFDPWKAARSVYMPARGPSRVESIKIAAFFDVNGRRRGITQGALMP